MIELVSVEMDAAEKLRQVDIDWFLERRVPPLALAKSHAGDFAFVQRDRVVFDGARFEFERYAPEDSQPTNAYVMPVLDLDGEAADIVAFKPGRVGVWLGRASMVGEEQVLDPRVGDDALDVHETVLDWLRHDRRGVVIVNHRNAAWLLCCAGPLRARNLEHGRQLRAALTIPAPKILVRDDMPWPARAPNLHLVGCG